MTVLSYQSIKALAEGSTYDEVTQDQNGLIWPFSERTIKNGKSYGISSAGYDIRIKLPDPLSEQGKGVLRFPDNRKYLKLMPETFFLASSVERIKMPDNLIAIVHDKSSWARNGLALQNTVLEPGWEGFITLELTGHGNNSITIIDGDPIAQLLFHRLDEPTEMPYSGKYQNQADEPVPAIMEAVTI